MKKLYSLLVMMMLAFTQLNAQYCTPAFPLGCSDGDQINSFEIPSAAFSHLNTGCSAGAYGDFTSMTINLTPTVPYPFSITHGFTNQSTKIWIDFDNNGTFTDAAPELVWTGSSTGTGSTTITNGSFTIPAGTPNGSYRMRVADRYGSTSPLPCNTDGYGEAHDYTVIIGPPPACPQPTLTSVTNVNATGATLNWTAPTPAPAGGYQIYYSTTATPPTATTVPNVTAAASPTTISTLNPNTTYFWWVRADCGAGSTSFWANGGSFTTTQIAGSFPYIQDFSGTNDFGFTTGTQTNKWATGSATGNPAPSMYISNDNGTSNTYSTGTSSTVHAYRDLLVPAGTTLASLQFDWKNDGENNFDYLRVFVAPASFQPVAGTQITASPTIQKLGPDYVDQVTWKTELFTNVNLAPYAGQTVRLIFEWRNDTFGGTQPPAAVDNINFSIPTCQVPSNPTVTAIGTTTATLNWTAASPVPQNGYEYYYSTSPTPPTAATPPSGTALNSPVVLNTLTNSTTYFWWVRSSCIGTDRSFWVQGPTFSTTQIPVTLPYSQPFTTSNGFTFVNGNQTNKWAYGSATGNPAPSIYISNDNGVSNAYTTNTASVVHAYRDFVVPAGTTLASLQFDWKSKGETGLWDYIRVYVAPTSFTPTAGTQITASATIQKIGPDLYNEDTWITELFTNVNLAPYAGQTVRLIFQWRNDTSGGTQPPAAIDNINFSIPTCQVPTNLTVTAIGATTATLNWNAAVPAPQNGYEYYYSTNPAPPTGATIPNGTVAGPPVILNTLTSSTTYYWWVRSKCIGSDRSYWIQGPSFTTTQIPATFPYTTGFDTDNGGFSTVNGNVANKWYWGNIVGNPPGSMYVSDSNGATNTYNIASTSVSHIYRDILVPAGTTSGVLKYQWKNVGENGFDYMRVWVVPVTYPPVAGTQTTAGANRIQLGGNHVGQTTWKQESYNNVNLTAYAGNTVRLIFEWRNDGIIGNQPPAALDNVVFARCETTAPVLTITPTHNSATVEWQQDLGGANYILQWREVGSTTWNGPFNIAALAFPATQHTFTMNGLDPATQYEVEIIAVCNGVQGTPHNEVFTTKCDPSAPINVTFTNITSTSAVVSWDPTAGAVNYVVEYRKFGDATWTTVNVNGATTTTLSSLLPYTQYEVRVASNCSGAINTYSPPKILLTRPTCEMAPVGLTVNNITMTQALVEWDVFPGATYVLRYRKVGNASWTTVNVTTNSYLLTGLTEETMYEVQVANICNGGQQAFTVSYVFTTPTVQYCGMSANSSSVEYISNVTVTPNGMPQMVNNSNASAYSEYISDPTKEIVLVQGSSNNQISIAKAWTGGTTYDETVSAWIDFNRNGIFEVSEKIVSSPASKTTPITATFAVPNDAYVSLYNNRYMVMRVIIARDNFPMLCSNFDNGEVEDYKVRIVKGLPSNVITDGSPQIYPNPVKDELNVTKVLDGSSYKIYSAIGRLVQRGNLLYNKVNVSQLSNGIYIIEVDNNGELVQKKFIKE